MLALVNAVQLLLQLISSSRHPHLDYIVDVFGQALNTQGLLVAFLLPSLVDHLLVVSDYLLEFGKCI